MHAAPSSRPQQPASRTVAHVALFLCASGLVGACGGSLGFRRDDSAPRYKALAYNFPVAVVATMAELQQPIQVLGTFTVVSRSDDRGAAESTFKKSAPKYGCDAVAGVAATMEEKKAMRAVKTMGKDGKPESRQEEYVIRTWRWSGQCVRTSAVGLTLGAEPLDPATQLAGVPAADRDVEGPGGSEASPAVREMCTRMDRYTDGYLKAWKEKLRAPKPEAMDVLEAWTELMLQISGPGGFWKKTVPTLWYGCGEDPASDPCKRLETASRDLAKWDAMQAQIGSLGRGQASGFLRRNQKKLVEYLDTAVPDEPSLSAMQATPFYKQHLAP